MRLFLIWSAVFAVLAWPSTSVDPSEGGGPSEGRWRSSPIIITVPPFRPAAESSPRRPHPLLPSAPSSSFSHPLVLSPSVLPGSALELPTFAPRPFVVPYPRSPLTYFDYSLPSLYRISPSEALSNTLPQRPLFSPDEEYRHKFAMSRYHFDILGSQRVPRPMEVNYPRLSQLSEVEGQFRAHAAQLSLRQNAWLLNGAQVILLNRAQFKLRRLTLFPTANEWEDKVENSSLRSNLDKILKTVQRGDRGGPRLTTFPQALRMALQRVKQEQGELQAYQMNRRIIDMFWDATFPFLNDASLDVEHALMHH